MKVLAVVQARMASQRLPGKVLRTLGSRRALGWAVSAAMRATGVDQVVVATSINIENDLIADWCVNNDVACYRGNEDDVLARYVGIVEEYAPDNIIRITADCPLSDSNVIGHAIALHHATGASYTTNQWPINWPDGLDVEVVKSEAILAAGEEATDPIDRATVTQFIYRNQYRWPSVSVPCPLPGLDKERWVLDSPEDLIFMKHVFGSFPEDWQPNYLDVWTLLNENPEWRKINQTWTRNQRFYEALCEQPSPEKRYDNSKAQFERAKKVIPFASQTFSKSSLFFPKENFPQFASHGDGGYVFDIDGNRYVDLVGSLGPNILGYHDPDVDWAVRHQLDRGVTFSLATELEAELAEKLVDLIPCAEMVKFGKNGSDVTGAAVRIARAYTGRKQILMMRNGYHGWHDWSMGPSERNSGIIEQRTVVDDSSDLHIKPGFLDYLSIFAAVVINPEAYNSAQLGGWKKACELSGSLLIFDEVITGFRYDLGGYQKHIGVTPDLACFGKAMANGYPISAIVGKREYMQVLEDPKVFWSGTFFGEAASIAAALTTIRKLEEEKVLDHIKTTAHSLTDRVSDLLYTYGLEEKIKIKKQARATLEFADKTLHQLFMQTMAREGVLILNSHMLNYCHRDCEVQRIVTAYDNSLRTLSDMREAA